MSSSTDAHSERPEPTDASDVEEQESSNEGHGSCPDLGREHSARHRVARAAAIALVALLGAVVGSTLAGKVAVDTTVGTVELSARPATAGALHLSLAPLGGLEVPALHTPVAVTARLVDLRRDLLVDTGRGLAAEAGSGTVDARGQLEGIGLPDARQAVEQIERGVRPLVLRLLLGAALGGAAAVLLVFRAWRPALVGAGIGLLGMGAFVGVTAATADTATTDARPYGAVALLPQVDPKVSEGARGAVEYAARVLRNMEGLYTGYVRSAAAERIARQDDRLIAVTADPTDDEVRRQVGVLARSQGAKAVVWIESRGSTAHDDGTAAGSTPGEPTSGDPTSGEDAFPEVPDEVPVLFVEADAAPAIRAVGPFAVLVLGPPGSPLTDEMRSLATQSAFAVRPDTPRPGAVSTTTSTTSSPATVVPGLDPPSAPTDLPVVSTGNEPGARGKGLTDDRGVARLTTGTATPGRLEAVILSFTRTGQVLEQAQLVTVADGEVSMKRVLR